METITRCLKGVTAVLVEYKSRDRYNVEGLIKFGVLYFVWPSQPSSGTMRIYTGRAGCLGSDHGIFVIPEIRKTNLVDSVKLNIK